MVLEGLRGCYRGVVWCGDGAAFRRVTLIGIPRVGLTGLTGVYLCLMRPIVSTPAGQSPARHNCCQIFSKDLAVIREDGGGWPFVDYITDGCNPSSQSSRG